MILQKLTLKDFRQFREEQEIIFSDLQDRNVTLIHAENKFGKTTLLNAILWGFYGHEGLTPDLEKPECLIHEGTAAKNGDPSSIAASVDIQFEHEGDRYFLSRTLSLAQQRLDHKKSELTLNVMREGRTFPEAAPQRKINSILPPGISPHIFFNGERIDLLAMRENVGKVTEAIEQMLGLKLLSAAIKDLEHNNVRGILRRELKDSTSDEKSALIDQLNELDASRERILKDQADCVKNTAAIAEEVAKINQQLEKDREAHELQKQRELLEARQQELHARIEDVRKKLIRLLAEDGYTLFGEDLVLRGKEIVSRLRSEGKIPARVLNSFLEELLRNKSCICNRCLEEGSPERAAVENLLSFAADLAFNNAVGALDHALGVIEESGRKTRDQMSDLNRERLQLEQDLKVVGEQIDEIHQRMGTGAPNMASLESRRSELLLKQGDLKNQEGRFAQRLEDNEKQCTEKKAQISAIEDEEENARRAQRRLNALDDCVHTLQRILDAERQSLRPFLNDEINKHFRSITVSDYWAELSDDFVLSIRKKVIGAADTDVAKSTGERQITSLVFIGSLVALARQRSQIPTILRGLSGSVYPLVMDSPFGQLGDHFTSRIARLLPALASQVIVLVTQKQYRGAVEQEMSQSGRIGKRYMLVHEAPSLIGDVDAELVIAGNRYQQYSRNDQEMTRIAQIDI
jgi:DNA sulfur modification protein DndD